MSLDQLRGFRKPLDSLKSDDNYELYKTFDENDEPESNISPLSSMITFDEVLNAIQNERTFEDLRKDYESFKALGVDNAKARLCNITMNPCIFLEDDSARSIDKIPLPELHILIGLS